MDYFITDYKTGESPDKLVALEDSIMQKGMPVTAGSKILEGFISPIDATVITRLRQAGYVVAGKTAMNEFGIVKLFDDGEETCAAVKAVADGIVKFALCNDFSGAARRSASKAGIFYIHPTYGTVSRFGLIPMISSMDQIGIACRDFAEGFELLSVIAGNDSGDGAMLPDKSYKFAALNVKLKAGIPSGICDLADELNAKFDIIDCELKYFDVFRQVQLILGCAEISNNINRYDGIKFGYRTPDYKGLNDLYLKTRTQGFGPDTKLAAIMGAMVLSTQQYVPYYEKAMKIRRLIKESLEFGKYDIIILPSRITGGAYEQTGLYALATLAGLPSVSVPYGQGGGIQIIADAGNENALLTALEALKA